MSNELFFHLHTKSFSCIFLIDTSPYSLYLTTLGQTPVTIEWAVDKSFEVTGYIEPSLYRSLCKYLNLQYNPEKPFKPTTILEVLNRNTPTQFISKPTYRDVLKIAGQNTKDFRKNRTCFWYCYMQNEQIKEH